MKTFATAITLAAVGLMATSGSLSAQWVWVGGGGAFPVSDYGEYASTGIQVTAGFGYPIGEGGLSVGLEGIFGQNSHTDTDGDKTNPYAVFGMLGYDFGDADEAHPYLVGGAGILWHKYSSDTFTGGTESGLGLNVGGGWVFPLGGVNGWVEGRFTHGSIENANTSFVGALAGISIPLGS